MYVFCMSEALCVRLHIYFNLQPPMIKTNFFFTVPSVHDLAGVDVVNMLGRPLLERLATVL